MLFYKQLFCSHMVVRPDALPLLASPTLSLEGCHVLMGPVTREEVAIMGIKSFKAPGLDGFQPFLYKHY